MTQEKWKKAAAREVAELVKEDMIVGLGSGSTVSKVIKFLSEREVDATFIASSSAIQQLADRLGLHLASLDDKSSLDIVIDGADEVAPNFSLIKGGGGAHTREKIIASAGKEVVIVVDKTKLVHELGEKKPVPVEVIPFAYEYTALQLKKLKGDPRLRKSSVRGPYITDNGNYILDTRFDSIKNPSDLESNLNDLPGVVENGIFVGLADRLFIGYEKGCEILETRRDFMRFLEGLRKN